MKKTLIILLITSVIDSIQAQKINTSYVGADIDTVYFFYPFGFVSTFYQNQRKTSPELTQATGETLSKLIFFRFPVTSFIINDSMINNDYKTQDKIIVNLDNLKTIKRDIFQVVPTSDFIDSLISIYPGRYFGFIYFSGFINNKVRSTMVASVAMIIVTTIITAGILTMYLIPEPSELIVKLLIIDKEEKKLVFYNEKKTSTLSMKFNIDRLVDKSLRKYKKMML